MIMSERYYNSRQSNLEKNPVPSDHEEAIEKVANILRKNGWTVQKDNTMRAVTHWTVKDDISIFKKYNQSYIHSYDISAIKQHQNGLVDYLIVEVDGSIHSKIYQHNRDERAEYNAKFSIPDVYFIRLNKDDVNQAFTEDDILNLIKKKI